MNAITAYINGAIAELHQVRWPTRQQAIRLSFITLGFVFGTSAIFGVIDFGLSQVVKSLLSLT
jgi:preprotein translocase SecE subunit